MAGSYELLDAGRPGSPADTSSDTIEMATLDAVTPDPRLKHAPYVHDTQDSEDEESGDEDDGERALLTPHDRPRGWERISQSISLWKQVQRIVIEVCLFCCC